VMTERQSFGSGDDRGRTFDDDEDEGTRTLPTTAWSAQSSPGQVSDTVMKKEMELRVRGMRSFEDVDEWEERRTPMIPNRTSVGVAF